MLFCEDDDWAIDRRGPIANQIMDLAKQVKMTKIHEHKGTYRMRAWLIPKGAAADPATPFGGQEA